MEHDDFGPFLGRVWNAPRNEDGALFKLAARLKAVKGEFKIWNREVFKRVELEIVAGLLIVDELDKKEEVGFLSIDDRIRRIVIKCQLDRLWRCEEISWRQKSREVWLKEGDRNTKFFHRVANFNRRRNHLEEIKVDGIRMVGQRDIAEAAVSFYKQLYEESTLIRPFASEVISKALPSALATSLEAPVTVEEIWLAVRSCGAGKAPGPDGFPLEFYKANWQVVHKEVCDGVLGFFDGEEVPRGINK
ncbi:hypothetical protein LINPERHAP2_LOCUS29203 [Linum perenne]